MLIAVIILCALLIAALGGLFWAYHKVFFSLPRKADEIHLPLIIANKTHNDEIIRCAEAMRERPCAFVTTRAGDGLKLSARVYHHDDSAPLCICFHGYRGSAIRDFSMMAPLLIDSGYNVLLPDERAHWRSGGHTITYGIRERHDVLTWVEYAIAHYGNDRPIYLFGISMGAATVLMASGLQLPDNVRAICADCPYNSPKDVICHVADKIGLSPKGTWPIIRTAAWVFGHFNICGTTAAEEVAKTNKPILIIHGEGDDFVPPDMSRQIYDANPAMVERHTFPGAGHGVSYLYDTERYQAIVKDFLKRHP